MHWHDTTVRLLPGTTLVLYTDGVTDAGDGTGARFGSQRLASTLATQGTQPAADAVAAWSTRSTPSGRPHADDVAILAVRYTAEDAPSDDRAEPQDATIATAGAGTDD